MTRQDMGACKATPIAHRLTIAALTIAMALAFAGCDYFGFTPIKEIAASPAQFEGKEVKIKGKVVDPVQLLGIRVFTLRDEAGEIAVTTSGVLPSAGTAVAIKGKVRTAVIVSGNSFGTRVEETQRLR